MKTQTNKQQQQDQLKKQMLKIFKQVYTINNCFGQSLNR